MEHDTRSDCPGEEECGTPYENVWNEVWNRIKIRPAAGGGKIHIKLEENDDPSVLTFLEDIIKQGVSSEFLLNQMQIEQVHNAIVSNPSAGNRVKDMRRLEKLTAESTEPMLYMSEVNTLEIPNAKGFKLSCMNIKFIIVGNPSRKLIEQLRNLPDLEYLTITGRIPIFSMYDGFDALELLTLENVSSRCQLTQAQLTQLVCGSATSRCINIHIKYMQVPEIIAELFKNNRFQCTNVTVKCKKRSIGYQEWCTKKIKK